MTNPLIDNYNENVTLQKDEFNPLTPYNYGGNTAFVPLSSVMKIDVDNSDKILSLIDNKLSSSLNLKFENGNLILLGKNDEVIGQVSLPLDHFLKEAYYDAETKELVFVFNTSTGENTARINVSDLVDTYTAGKGLKVSDNEFSIDETVVGTKDDIKTINDNLVLSINTINQNMADGFNTINGGIENEIKPEIAKKVEWTDIHTEEYPERKAIVLKNHDMLLGTDTTGSTYNLAMVSKWDIADYGSSNLLTNINSKERPTVQLPGVSGEDAEKIAFLSDIPNMEDFATKDEVAAVDSKFGDRFLSGATVSEAIISIEGNLSGETALREQADINLNNQITKAKDELQQADNQIAQNLQGVSENLKGVSDRVTALETGTTGSTVIDNLKSDVETLKTDNTALKSDVSNLELTKVDWTDIHTEEYPERKAMVIKNHDMLLGTDTTGGTYNLAMVNKWDVADYGSSNLLTNINSKERPTVQLPGVSGEDAEKIAFLSDIPSTESFATKDEVNSKLSSNDVLSNLSLSSTTDSLHYELSYSGTSLGQIAIPEDQFLESVEYVAKATEDDRKIEPSVVIVGDPYLKFVFRITGNKKVYTYIPIKTIVSDLATKDEVNGFGIVNLGDVTLSLEAENKAVEQCLTANNVIFKYTVNETNNGLIFNNILADGSVQQTIFYNGEISKRKISSDKIAGNWEKMNEVIIADKCVNSMTLFKLTTGSTSEEIQNSLKYDGLYSSVITKEDLDKCLKYGFFLQDAIMREMVQVSWNGNSYVLTEIGHFSPKTDIKCGTIAISINDEGEYSVTKDGVIANILSDKNIAQNSTILSIISNADSFKTTILDKFEMLEGKLNSLIFDEAETVESYDGTQELNDVSKSYVISDANITNSSNIVAKNVTMDNAELSNNARMSVKAKDVTFNSLNVSGDFPKSNGNSVVKVDEAEYVIFKDMTFDSSNVYNGIEIGLSTSATTLPKNVIFENCKFTGTFSNNAILIFATQDNAIITLSNCQFDKVSNLLRLSNRTNAKNITVNVVNCSVAQWDTNQYAGFLICQDYTSSASDVETNNLFGDNKINVNFINLMHKGSKVLPADISSVCGTGTVDQVAYVYTDASGAIVPYSADKYPVIKFS